MRKRGPSQSNSGWTGQWDRDRWSTQPRRRARRRGRDLWLVVLGGIAAGLAWQGLGPGVQQATAAPEPHAITGSSAAGGRLRVIDGDTFDYAGERIRIADIDTPEIRARCPEEARLAAAATRRLRGLLAEGPFELRRLGRDEDRYGRKLRVVTRGGRSLGDKLVAEGLARTWTGRREPWC